MKRFHVNVANPWSLILTAKLISQLRAGESLLEGEESQEESSDSPAEEVFEESDSQEHFEQGGDEFSEGLVDPARTRVVDPARTRVVDPARTRVVDPART